jgi:hypothetical protein
VTLKRWFHRAVLSRRWLTFLIMGMAFFVFGAGTVNIFMLFVANADYISSYGWEALLEGGAQQFVELVVSGYLSMAAYLTFKACEYRLVRNLCDDVAQGPSDAHSEPHPPTEGPDSRTPRRNSDSPRSILPRICDVIAGRSGRHTRH